MRTVKISRRAFLTGLGLASTAALLSACNTVPASSHSGAAPSQPDSEAPASSAASEVPAQPILSVDEFPITDGSTACIPLIAQIMADTTGLDLETARSAVTTNTTAQAWRNLGLYGNNYGDSVKLIIAYEAPESVKEELKADGDPLEQKAIGRDALVFIVNEENPVQSLTQQQLRDIYAGKITNWKDVGGKDQAIVAFQRGEDSGSQTLFKKLLIQGIMPVAFSKNMTDNQLFKYIMAVQISSGIVALGQHTTFLQLRKCLGIILCENLIIINLILKHFRGQRNKSRFPSGWQIVFPLPVVTDDIIPDLFLECLTVQRTHRFILEVSQSQI